LDSLIGVLLGWLLGILGQRPIIYIQQSFKKPAVKKGIIAELQDLRYRLAYTSYVLLDRTGYIDKKYLQWIYPIIQSYKGYYTYLGLADTVAKILEIKDDELEAAMKTMKSSADLKQGLTVRKFSYPFIDANYGDLHMFDIGFQKNILEIREQIKNINDEIDNARFYFTKTFDSGLSKGNAIIVKKNLESSYGYIAKMSIDATNNLSTIIERAT